VVCYNLVMDPKKQVFADLAFLAHVPRQRHFLTRFLPPLQDLDWIQAIWLSGSFARGDGDRWSDLNLHLLVEGAQMAQVLGQLCSLLDRQVEEGWHASLEAREMVSGLTFVVETADATRGGVHFTIRWTGLAHLQSHLHRYRPLRLLFARHSLSNPLRDFLDSEWPALLPPDRDALISSLACFWMPLSRLPAVLNRGEHLAATQLLVDARRVLIELVVALNGAGRPPSPARINQYLGPAQLEAFEKTLPAKTLDPATWIGQAVALIVLYRWYAPQLVEIYTVPYPAALERTVLALLSAEIDGWPALIQTG
jgi:predicted nucleotidyltransferase